MTHSQIFGRNSRRNLTKYEREMNEVSMQLCLQTPNLLSDRKALREASRKKLDESGYGYKKGKSRSKRLTADEGTESSPKKRAKINRDFRLARIAELQEQIKDKKEQLEFKELRRDAAKNVHHYKECDKLTEQMAKLKAGRRQLEQELAALTKKQKKSEWYFNKTSTPWKVSASELNSRISRRFPSSSPEPQSSSFQSTPSPRFHVPVHPRVLRSPLSDDDDDNSGMLSPHESEDTVIISSDESSSQFLRSSSELPSHFSPPSSESSSQFLLCPSSELPSHFSPPSSESSSQFSSPSFQVNPPSLQRQIAFRKPNELVQDCPDSSQPSRSTSMPPCHPCSGDTPSSVVSGQHFQ